MKRYLIIFVLFFSLTALWGQTIIDLKPGGGVRSKTAEDYRKEQPGLAEKIKADSILYNDHLIRALNALHRDSIQEAEQLLQAALRLRPTATSNYIVHQYLGRIAMAQNNYRKAIGSFTTILKDWPENREARFDRSSCYLEIKNPQAALEDCEILFHDELTKAERIKALFLRSACHTASRHPEKAKRDLEEILSLDGNNTSALLLLPLAYDQMGQPQEALNRLNLFVASHPQSVDGLVARAELEVRLHMKEVARADYDRAIQMAPHDATLYVKRGLLLLEMERPQQAEKDIRKAIELGYPADALLPYLNTNLKK